jgi:hypothetical protein
MAKLQVIKDTIANRNTQRAYFKIITSGSGLKRAGQALNRVLNGEADIPTSVDGIKDLLKDNILGKTPDKYYYLSRFGTPVRNYLKVNPGSYDVIDSNGTVTKRSYQGTFIDSAIISVNQPKNIVMTGINGKNGTRKEFFSNGDYEIKIEGEICSDHQDIYPMTEVQLLRDIVNSPEPITVICPHLLIFGVSTIVITGADFPQNEGFYNTQKFSLTAVSHSPVDMYIELSAKELAKNKSRLDGIIQNANEKIIEIKSRVDDVLIKAGAERLSLTDADLGLTGPSGVTGGNGIV